MLFKNQRKRSDLAEKFWPQVHMMYLKAIDNAIVAYAKLHDHVARQTINNLTLFGLLTEIGQDLLHTAVALTRPLLKEDSFTSLEARVDLVNRKMKGWSLEEKLGHVAQPHEYGYFCILDELLTLWKKEVDPDYWRLNPLHEPEAYLDFYQELEKTPGKILLAINRLFQRINLAISFSQLNAPGMKTIDQKKFIQNIKTTHHQIKAEAFALLNPYNL